MNLTELVLIARDWLDDENEPYLWGDDKLKRWANEAQEEACLRTRFLTDNATSEVCTITLVDGQAVYPLHPSIVVVRRFEYRQVGASLPVLMGRTTTAWLDSHGCGEWTGLTGKPSRVAQDLRARNIRLDRIPTADDLGTINLNVWRRPLGSEQLEGGNDVPVIDSAFHIQLAHWICYRAFLKKDDEAYDGRRAADHLAQFEAAFGHKPTLQRLIELATDDSGESEPYWY